MPQPSQSNTAPQSTPQPKSEPKQQSRLQALAAKAFALLHPKAPVHLGTAEGIATTEQMFDAAIQTNDLQTVFKMLVQAEEVLKKTHPNFEKEEPELYQRLQAVLTRARWAVFDRLNPATVEQLLSQHAELLLQDPLETTLEKLRVHLLGEPSWEERDRIKERFRTALMNATALLGTTQIQVTGATAQPQIGQWLRDFREFLQNRQPNALLIVEYLNTSANARQLAVEQKAQLELLLKVYHSLTLSSLKAEGNETQHLVADPVSGTYKEYAHGQFTETGVAVSPEDLKELREEYGLTEDGKPMSIATRVKNSDQLDEIDTTAEEAELEAQLRPQMSSDAEPDSAETAAPVAPRYQQPLQVEAAPLAPSPLALELLEEIKKQANTKPIPYEEEPEEPETIPQPEASKLETPQPPITLAPIAQKGAHLTMNVAQQVLRTYQLLFPSVELEKRFLTLISTYLQGSRSRAETRILLSKTPAEGGAHLPSQQVEGMLDTADNLFHQAFRSSYQSQSPTAQPTKPQNPQAPNFDAVQKRIAQAKLRAEKMNPQPTQPEVEDVLAPVSPVYDTAQLPTSPQETDAAPQFNNAASRIPRAVFTDITSSHNEQAMIMGPVEEFANMNTTEFRRLAKDPATAAQKLLQKMQLLEQESLLKKAKGIDAWKSSPLNQLYVQIGTRSFETTQSVEQVITDMRQRGEDALNPQEFSAIADFNQQIRY